MHHQFMPLSTIFLLCLISTLFTLGVSRPPECDARTKPPKDPPVIACNDFLEYLSIKAHRQPRGEYRWYGRKLEPCDQCVKLPTIIHHGDLRCATLIDVDDENEDVPSIFGLSDLRQALSDVLGFCWLVKKRNGRGYPGGQAAWAAFTAGVRPPRLEITWKDLVASRSMEQERERRNVTIIDISKW